MDHVS